MTQTTIQRPLANNDMDETGSGKNLTTPEFKHKLVSLLTYLQHHLQFQTMPAALKLINSKKNSDNPFGLTGYYDHTTKKITLYITDRHDTDVLRSFAHEVIHHWQNERGVLHPEDKGAKVQGNNDASPHYAQNNPWLRKREMEAYLFGNILFRDWQDEQRMGPPNQYPFLPQPYD
jgi:hypothetical protein